MNGDSEDKMPWTLFFRFMSVLSMSGLLAVQLWGCGATEAARAQSVEEPGEIAIDMHSGFSRFDPGSGSIAVFSVVNQGRGRLLMRPDAPVDVRMNTGGQALILSRDIPAFLEPGARFYIEVAIRSDTEGVESGVLSIYDANEQAIRFPFEAVVSLERQALLAAGRCGTALGALIALLDVPDRLSGTLCIRLKNIGDQVLDIQNLSFADALPLGSDFTITESTEAFELAVDAERDIFLDINNEPSGVWSTELVVESEQLLGGIQALPVTLDIDVGVAWLTHYLLGDDQDIKDALERYGALAADAPGRAMALAGLYVLRYQRLGQEYDANQAKDWIESIDNNALTPTGLAIRGLTYSFIASIKEANGGKAFIDKSVNDFNRLVQREPGQWLWRFLRGTTFINMGNGIKGNIGANLVFGQEANGWIATGKEDLSQVRARYRDGGLDAFQWDQYDRVNQPIPRVIDEQSAQYVSTP